MASVYHSLFLSHTSQLDYTPLGKKVAAFRLVTQSAPVAPDTAAQHVNSPLKGFISKAQMQGIAPLRELKAYAKGEQTLEGVVLAGSGYFVVSAKFKADLAKLGYVIALERNQNAIERLTRKAYDRYLQGKLSTDDIVQNNADDYWVMDLDGQPLAQALEFSYMEGRVHDGAYDLERTLNLLQKNPQVSPLSGKRLRIEEIPYYNQSPNQRHHIEFAFSPTTEQAHRMHKAALKLNRQFASLHLHHAVFELDLLGLRKGGAALFTGYHEAK